MCVWVTNFIRTETMTVSSLSMLPGPQTLIGSFILETEYVFNDLMCFLAPIEHRDLLNKW